MVEITCVFHPFSFAFVYFFLRR